MNISSNAYLFVCAILICYSLLEMVVMHPTKTYTLSVSIYHFIIQFIYNIILIFQ